MIYTKYNNIFNKKKNKNAYSILNKGLRLNSEGRANIGTIPLNIRIHVRVGRVAMPRDSSTILTRSPIVSTISH